MSVLSSSTSSTRYTSEVLNPCAQPGGCTLCAYTFLCPCLAAGDIARFTGRNSCLSIADVFCCVGSCFCWKDDREAVERFYNIKPIDASTLFCCCVPCILAQTLNHIKAVQISEDLASATLVSAVEGLLFFQRLDLDSMPFFHAFFMRIMNLKAFTHFPILLLLSLSLPFQGVPPQLRMI